MADFEIKLVCSVCERQLSHRLHGVIQIDPDGVRRHRQIKAAKPDTRSPGLSLVSAAETAVELKLESQLNPMPQWLTFCDDHLPGWGYDIDTERMHTWHQVAEWTAQVCNKTWFDQHTWSRLLRSMGCYGNG